MNIDEMDFRRSYEWWYFWHLSNKNNFPKMPSAGREYIGKIKKYKERFDNPMPIPLRKCLLKQISLKAEDK